MGREPSCPRRYQSPDEEGDDVPKSGRLRPPGRLILGLMSLLAATCAGAATGRLGNRTSVRSARRVGHRKALGGLCGTQAVAGRPSGRAAAEHQEPAPTAPNADRSGGDHRRRTRMERVDDLGPVDPLEVGAAPRGAMRKEMTDESISSVLVGMPALG